MIRFTLRSNDWQDASEVGSLGFNTKIERTQPASSMFWTITVDFQDVATMEKAIPEGSSIEVVEYHPVVCPTCGHEDHEPHRVYFDDGSKNRVLEGCVDEFHTGRLLTVIDNEWHYREDSVRVREYLARERG